MVDTIRAAVFWDTHLIVFAIIVNAGSGRHENVPACPIYLDETTAFRMRKHLRHNQHRRV